MCRSLRGDLNPRARSAGRSGTGWGEHLDAARRSRLGGEPGQRILCTRSQRGVRKWAGKVDQVRRSLQAGPEKLTTSGRLKAVNVGAMHPIPGAVELGLAPRSVQTRLRQSGVRVTGADGQKFGR